MHNNNFNMIDKEMMLNITSNIITRWILCNSWKQVIKVENLNLDVYLLEKPAFLVFRRFWKTFLSPFHFQNQKKKIWWC